MVKLRLKRIGKKQKPFYRIVAADSRVNRNGQYIELVGTFDPLKDEIKLNKEVALAWLQKGAQPTDTVRDLLSKEGVMTALHNAKLEAKAAEPKKEAKPKKEKKVEVKKPVTKKATPKAKVVEVSEEDKIKAQEFLIKAEEKYSKHLNEEVEVKEEHKNLSTTERAKVDGSETIDEARHELQKHANALRSLASSSDVNEKVFTANLRNMTKKEIIKYMKKIRESLKK